MIARIWRGVTLNSNSDEYLEYVTRTGVRDCRATEGNRGVWVLWKVADGRAEFLFISLWESFDAIRKFAGHIRPHEGLDGKTPAEACGIEVQGENKWLTLIQNARRSVTVKL